VIIGAIYRYAPALGRRDPENVYNNHYEDHRNVLLLVIGVSVLEEWFGVRFLVQDVERHAAVLVGSLLDIFGVDRPPGLSGRLRPENGDFINTCQ